MKVLFGKAIWGMAPCATELFLDRAKSDGFDAVEMTLYVLKESPAQIAELCRQRGLALVCQVNTNGSTPAGHLAQLEKSVRQAAEIRPALINIHTGKDWFDEADNRALFQRGVELSSELKVGIVHETHRSRALYSAFTAARFLRDFPALRLCADFSHWMVVHGSGLVDQPESMKLATSRADYIHARVGYSESPQVPHPLAPEYSATRDRHVELWREILAQRRAEGREQIIITPEFGPAPYMPRLPFTNQPVADEWRVNVEFRDWLRDHL